MEKLLDIYNSKYTPCYIDDMHRVFEKLKAGPQYSTTLYRIFCTGLREHALELLKRYKDAGIISAKKTGWNEYEWSLTEHGRQVLNKAA